MKVRISVSDVKNAPLINKNRIAEDIGNSIVLAPHPDDESLGCGGLIAMLRASGKNVIIIFITSGSASHLHSATHPPHKLAALRESEAKAACLVLGVRPKNVFFLKAQDGGLQSLDSTEIDELVETIAAISLNRNMQSILFPWRRDPHPDHIMTNTIGKQFVKAGNDKLIQLEYPIWLWNNGLIEDWPLLEEVKYVRLNIKDYVSVKKEAIEKHKSQLGHIIKDDSTGFVLTENLLKPFEGNYEYYFTEKDRQLNSLDKSYFEHIYNNSSDPWNFKNSTYENEKYKTSILAIGEKKFKKGFEIGCSIGVQTKLLAERCDTLLAVDINEKAVKEAKLTCKGKDNIKFKVLDISKDFPKGKYDLITLCEVGYYLDKNTLVTIFQDIHNALLKNGRLLVVHWIGFVPEYPLSGDDVHNSLKKFLLGKNKYVQISNQRNELYKLDVWEKIA
ncbi:PIG-L family deacetylase [Psychroserpens sp.]|uniref:PIG-L family deacetylase n=1 Tax=Psychroserpens sp. TaxID=2020870 RepID=UPI003C796034